MSASRRESQQRDAPALSLHASLPRSSSPPPPPPSASASATHTADSSSVYSIPDHSSTSYINSYYYGNEEMPDLGFSASASASAASGFQRHRSWLPTSRSASPAASLSHTLDDSLLRRLSWGTHPHPPAHHHPPSASPAASVPTAAIAPTIPRQASAADALHVHQRSGSSADAGLVRGPLHWSLHHQLSSIALDRTARVQDALYQLPLDASSSPSQRCAIGALAMLGDDADNLDDVDDVDDSDRIVLTSDQHPQRHQPRAHFAADGAPPGFARVDSPDQLEEGHLGPRHKSRADIYAAAGLARGPSLHGARSGLSRMGKSMKRLSKRVVHLDSRHSHVRLQETDEGGSDSDSSNEARYTATRTAAPTHQPEADTHPPAALQTLRGKSLGIWGPESSFRRLLASLLAHWWVEPLILLLIVANTVVLVIQSSRNVYNHPRKGGLFDYNEDYVLFGIFCIYTLEILIRIIVSGLIINPPPALMAAPIGHEAGADGEGHGQTEHRRQMSRSNTLDAFSDFGGALKGQAQRVIHGSRAAKASQHSASKSSSGSAYAMARQGSGDGDGARSPPRGTATLPPRPHPVRSQTQASAAMMLPSSDPAQFWQNRKSPFAGAFVTQRMQAVNHAFLRHSWNRVDLFAVIGFWVAFGLASAHQEATPDRHIYVFRALSVLRCARLLTATNGTTTILESLKMAAPILTTVAFFTAFAMLLFSIIGVQSFKGSYRRKCIWTGELMGEPGTNYTLPGYCGGYVDAASRRHLPYIQIDGIPADTTAKGFICPAGQICQETDTNPEGGTANFDNVLSSLLQNVIIISSNNWSNVMYDMMDADYYASCLFFIAGLIIMNFWLANLFVAVITNSFATLTAQTNHSAFADRKIQTPRSQEQGTGPMARRMQRVANVYKRVWGCTRYIWIMAIIADVGLQASRATWMEPAQLQARDDGELYFTVAFDVEILMRFLSFVLDGDWRSFLRSKQNIGDLVLAVVTSIIQIPAIRDSSVYAWLTFFQLARFYRVIAAVPRMRALLVRVFGSMVGLLNMVLFLLMMVGFAALIAVQLFRGDIPQEDDGEWTEMTFKHLFNAFLAMYQIFTSEDWVIVLYSVLSNETQFKQVIIGAVFLSGWFMLANFIVLQMFIAVISENFSIAEGEKRQQQLAHYLRRNEPLEASGTAKLLHKLSPYRYLRDRNAAKTGSAPTASVTGSSGDQQRSNAIVGGPGGATAAAAVSDDEKAQKKQSMGMTMGSNGGKTMWTIDTVKKVLRLDTPEEAVPLDTLRSRRVRQSLSGEEVFQAAVNRQTAFFDSDADDTVAKLFASERMLKRMRTDLGLPVEKQPGDHHYGSYPTTDADGSRLQQARFIANHPSYDKSYFLFSNHSSFRRFCQSLVPSAYGDRLFGRACSPIRYKVFQAIVFVGIAGSVVSAGIATPAYRRDYYAQFGLIRASWFSILEMSLSSLFVAEFLVKTIADGLAFTPNAYILNMWNTLDLFVLVTLLVNVGTELAVIGGVSRFTRALKAFRALRLINLSSLMRNTFHAVMIAGAGRILDASILAILYIIPYAVWGQNLFAGVLYSCNDSDDAILTKFDCFGEYTNSPGAGDWSFLAPRAWANPTSGSIWSFNDFKSSLLILFEIISLEGWIDVMSTAMSVVGRDRQLQNDNRQVNALFFLVYNLIGSTTVLTLFVAVIIENFQQFSGAAFQTTEQRQWIDLKKLIMRQTPSKRPKVKPSGSVRAWCYQRAVDKHGWWSRSMTFMYVANIAVLMTQRYGDAAWVDRVRDIIYLVFTMIYVADIGVRLAGLGWTSFKANPWNIYDLVVVSGTLGTTIPLLRHDAEDQFNIQFQKIFLTCVAFKLVQKLTSFNQLFKTARASLPAILSLFLLWLTMFLVWAIMLLEVFGLTKWGENETYNKNFSSLLNSLVFLSMMSTGEGWNTYMHDYTVSPPQCTPAASYLETDCGSEAWAFFLFITWNVISMYIFLNMFTGTVVENFSYLFELGGKPRLSREEVRAYKEAWARFDTDRDGYIAPKDIVPFLRSLSGALEVDLYPASCSVASLVGALESNTPLASPISPTNSSSKGPLERIREASPLRSPFKDGKIGERGHFMWPQSPTRFELGSEAQRLCKALEGIDAAELRLRRVRFNRVYHEALLSQRKAKGISFTAMLTILAHHKLVDDAEALSVEELIQRRELMELVDDRISLERVRNCMMMVYVRRRYLALRRTGQALFSDPETSRVPPMLPKIVVNSEASPPSALSSLAATDREYNDDASSQQQILASSPSTPTAPSRPAITVSTSSTSREDPEQTSSPMLAEFESTAWGDVMRRLSRSEHSLPASSFGQSLQSLVSSSAFRDGDEDEEEEKASLARSRD